MRRIVIGTVLMLCAALGVVAVAPAPAGAQERAAECIPGSDPGYPPVTPGIQFEPVNLVDLRLQVSSGLIGLEISGLVPGDPYCGVLYSTPIVLPTRLADPDGRVRYLVPAPADFELNALHHLDVYKFQKLVGAFDFCINLEGRMAPLSSCTGQNPSGGGGTGSTGGTGGASPIPQVLGSRTPTGGNLAKTGADHLLDLARVGAVLMAAGAIVRYAQRRRSRQHPA